jgi:hypothetical protein
MILTHPKSIQGESSATIVDISIPFDLASHFLSKKQRCYCECEQNRDVKQKFVHLFPNLLSTDDLNKA